MRNTSRIGEVCVAQVLAALVRQGKTVWLPFGDSRRADFLIEEEDGRFLRVQCKNARLINGAVTFYPCSVDSRSERGRCIRRGYRGQVELFGLYCPDNGKVYLMPVEHAGEVQCLLQVEPPRNNQRKGIRWARDYEIGAAPEPGEYSGLSVNGPVVTITPT